MQCCVVDVYACSPQLMSVGGSLLSFPRWVILLFHCNVLGIGPIHVAPEPVAPCSFALVLRLFVDAGQAVVFNSNWMKTMRAAVSSHVSEFLHLGAHGLLVVTAVGIDVLTIELGGHAGDGGGEFLDLRLHRHQFVCCLNIGRCVGCVVGHACTGELLDVLADLISIVCHLIGWFVPVVSCCSPTCFLFIGVGSIDDRFEMRFGEVKVRFGCGWLPLPC